MSNIYASDNVPKLANTFGTSAAELETLVVSNSIKTAQLYKVLTLSTLSTTDTITAAEFIGGLIHQSSGTGILTMPTAASIVAAIPNVEVGSSFDCLIYNTGGGELTLADNGTTTIKGDKDFQSGETAFCRVYVTNATTSSEAVSVYISSAIA